MVRSILIIIAALLYSSFTTVHEAHAQQNMHMEDMKHTGATCVVLCNPTKPKDEKPTLQNVKKEDKKHAPSSLYALTSHDVFAYLSFRQSETARIATRFEPPPGLPAYIALSVFRP